MCKTSHSIFLFLQWGRSPPSFPFLSRRQVTRKGIDRHRSFFSPHDDFDMASSSSSFFFSVEMEETAVTPRMREAVRSFARAAISSA